MRLRKAPSIVVALIALSCTGTEPTGVDSAPRFDVLPADLELWSNNLAINHNVGTAQPDGTVVEGVRWGFGIAATVVDHNDTSPGDGDLTGIVEGGEFVGELIVLTPGGPYPDDVTYEWQAYNEGRSELTGKDYIQLYWGVGAEEADPLPPGDYTTLVLDRHGVEVGRHTITVTPGDIEAVQPWPIVLEPGPDAVLDDPTPTFTWAAYPVGPAAFIQRITVRGPAHLPPEEQLEYQTPYLDHDPSSEISVTYPEMAVNPVPAELPEGRYTLELHQNVSLGDDALRAEFYGAHALHQSFVVGQEPTSSQLGSAVINFASFPEGDGGRGPDYHWYDLYMPATGDFAETSPDDVHLEVNGDPVAVDSVVVHQPDAHEAGHEYVIEARGTFGGGPAPLGEYRVSVIDGSGIETGSYLIGSLEGYPDGMSHMSYPYPGAVIYDAEPTFQWDVGQLVYLGEGFEPFEHTIRLYSMATEETFHASAFEASSMEFVSDTWDPRQPDPLTHGEYEMGLASHYRVRPGITFSRHKPFPFHRGPYVSHGILQVSNFVQEIDDGVPPGVDYRIGMALETVGDFLSPDPGMFRFVAPDGSELEIVDAGRTPGGGLVFSTGPLGAPPLSGQYSVEVVDANGIVTPPYLSEPLEDYPRGSPVLVSPEHGSLVGDPPLALSWTPFASPYLGEPIPSWGYEVRLWGDDGDYHFWPSDDPWVSLADERWTPEAPAPLSTGKHYVAIHSNHAVRDRIHFEHHWFGSFVVGFPETLIIDPEDHVTTAACPIYPDYIVQDQAALRVAMELAQPGQVIGVDGMIEIQEGTPGVGLFVDIDDLTITCASAGSGIAQRQHSPASYMIAVVSEGVTISHLTLDATHAERATVYGVNTGDQNHASGLRVLNNEMTCGPWLCVWTAGVAGSVVADNVMDAHGSIAGAWFQGHGAVDEYGLRARPTDGTRVVDNTIVQHSPGGSAGIRVRDGVGVVVTGNEVSGSFPRSIHLSNIRGSLVERNRVSGASDFALFVDGSIEGDRVSEVLVKNNHLRNAGLGGAYLNAACGNTLIGNNYNGNPAGHSIILDAETGANTVNGVGKSIIDNGAFDCDGDGLADPNIIAGSGTPRRGVRLGRAIRDAVQAAKEIREGELR